MPATFVKGDFINEAPKKGKRALAVPVDMNGVTTSGIASAVVKLWPDFGKFWADKAKTAQIGDAPAWTDGTITIYALGIQRGDTRAKISWVERAVRVMLADAAERELERINAPRLWGGPGGLEGLRVKRVLEDLSLHAPVALHVYEQFIRASAAPEPEDEEEEEEEAEDAPKPKKKAAAKKKTTAAAKPKKKAAAAKPKKKAAAAKKKK